MGESADQDTQIMVASLLAAMAGFAVTAEPRCMGEYELDPRFDLILLWHALSCWLAAGRSDFWLTSSGKHASLGGSFSLDLGTTT